MQPILRFIKHNGVWAVYDLVRYLVTTMGRQTVFDDAIFSRPGDQFLVDSEKVIVTMATKSSRIEFRTPQH